MNKRLSYASMIGTLILVALNLLNTNLLVRIGFASTAIALLAVAYAGMTRAIADRTRAKNETQLVVAQLELRICELQQRSREISLLADMSEMLHLSNGLAEAIGIVPSFGQRLFPTFEGAVYAVDPTGDVAELTSWWGAKPDPREFHTNDCWAMRRTHPHFGGGAQLMCRHHGDGDASERLCVPMLAFGDTMGVLTLRALSPASPAASIELVAKAFADQLSLAMASLRMQETLRTRAVRDVLTGLFNRHYLKETLTQELLRCKRSGAPVSVILIDIDWFKTFNDTFGHAGGDAMLQQFARLMQHVFRGEDVVCRYGGEEFVVMLPNTPLEMAIDCANRLREEVRELEPHFDNQLLGAVTISAGVAAAPSHGLDPDKLLGAADRALYAAKNAGRDRVIAAPTFVPTMQVVGRDAA